MNPQRRQLARHLARALTALSAVMLVFSITAATGGSASAAAINGGPLHVLAGPDAAVVGAPIFLGGSATKFYLQTPAAAACSGDSASGGYRVQSYMVPASIDPATLTFDSNGPIPNGTGASLRQPLFAGGSIYVDANTAVATTAGGPGAITGNPVFDFSIFGTAGPTVVPNGTYNVGIACTLGAASATQLDKYWNVQLTFTADANDQPSGIKWTTPNVVATTTTTTTSSTTTTIAGATTTVAATTTTVRTGTTTTTIAGGPTTTLLGATTTLVASGAGGTGSGSRSGGGTLAVTGSSPIPILVWGVLLLVFGRMSVLLGRRVKVLPPTSR